MKCQYEPGNRCANEAAVNFRFCVSHLNTPRGLSHIHDCVRRGVLLTQSDIDNMIDEKTRIPDKDAQTTALEKMLEELVHVMEFEDFMRRQVSDMNPSDWRFLDRTGSEQIRSEVVLYERAMDRTARVLQGMSKMALQEKIVSLGKAQTELMIRLLMATLNDLSLDMHHITRAKTVLLQKLREEAHLGSRVREHVTAELTGPTIVNTEEVPDGGYTTD
jgi:hypothetical protein